MVDGQPLPNDPTLVPLFDGTHLTGANPGVDQTTNQPVVAFTLDDTASKLFADYTRAHVNEFFAIVLDGTSSRPRASASRSPRAPARSRWVPGPMPRPR